MCSVKLSNDQCHTFPYLLKCPVGLLMWLMDRCCAVITAKTCHKSSIMFCCCVRHDGSDSFVVPSWPSIMQWHAPMGSTKLTTAPFQAGFWLAGRWREGVLIHNEVENWLIFTLPFRKSPILNTILFLRVIWVIWLLSQKELELDTIEEITTGIQENNSLNKILVK